MKIKFLGAVGDVTGSRFLLEGDKSQVLIDCGLYQGRGSRARNWEKFPAEPTKIDSVILTHAHLDHCGYLPKLVKEGFKGKIFCTEPTAEIVKITLLDSAKIQVEDAERKQRRHEKEGRKGPYPEVPLYTVEDAESVFPLIQAISYKNQTQITDEVKATFYDAGHVLGSSMIELVFDSNGKKIKAIFSGDIGRWDKPILNNPTTFDEADYVFMETTYGDRLHEEKGPSVEKLQKIIVETVEKGGNIIIPTFAIERTQELLFHLSQLLREKKIPALPVFVDSPMAINVTEVFKNHVDYFDEETRNLINNGNSPFDFPSLKTTRSSEDSRKINDVKEPSIIMAGSGMCTGGRIKYHLLSNITRPESTILFVGYQARGTLGREILERPETVRILGAMHEVKARIEKINGFSAHADREELLKWISGFKKAPSKIFLIHGEEEVTASFASFLKEKITSEIIIPEYSKEYIL
ncbi:MAG: MBL fold metallo-hydrolase [Candidatus Omnitrophica bacterium]|nr:MBL fold metallo-hydrolase [Candidatus Omnitrophota bacterium]MBU1047451.1 MBL fold metallo-hydrolase [Candidatus Omnitrophota bacterium]MBU1631447.1 MBL fold metallo-hydrolase [Candidatus Omnitrophota bacterium]MBU1766860.1 MBL fold metallo-hydrolase [Candidatus Omnitrophota bacterium]MBU1888814.1 MBL fold metallo-hydrolase [Candidatus Omnitrophota bacterium]